MVDLQEGSHRELQGLCGREALRGVPHEEGMQELLGLVRDLEDVNVCANAAALAEDRLPHVLQ